MSGPLLAPAEILSVPALNHSTIPFGNLRVLSIVEEPMSLIRIDGSNELIGHGARDELGTGGREIVK